MKKSLNEIRSEREKRDTLAAALASFRRWWEPHSYDEKTGASLGGHPHARRKWVRGDGEHGWYGEDAATAFKTQHYWSEFLDWKRNGEPELTFVSNALPLEEQAVLSRQLTQMARTLVNQMKASPSPPKGIVK